MNVITPSALKICGTKNHFYTAIDLKISCLISQKLNALLIDPIILVRMTMEPQLTAYFLICSCESGHVTPGHQAVWALCLGNYLIAWHWEYFRSGMYGAFFCSQLMSIFYSIAKSIQDLCWWELCHSIQGDKLDLRHYSALKYPGEKHP